MTEVVLLNFLLCVAFVLAPIVTNTFFLGRSRIYSISHASSLAFLFIGFLAGLNEVAFIWPIFCVLGGLVYLKHVKNLISPIGVARGIPFVFSVISSVWFVTGTNDLYLLGYGREWSFYAALHGAFLGWIFVGCLAHLASRRGASRNYLVGCFAALVLFLCVALGIDGVPYLKRIGVVGFTALVPFLIGQYAFSLPNKKSRSFYLALVSLGAITVSMILAMINEFWQAAPRQMFGMSTMALTHGLLNAIVVIPCFFFAIRSEEKVVA